MRHRTYGPRDDAPADVGDVSWSGVYLNAEPSQLGAGLLADGFNLRCRSGRPSTRLGIWKPAWLNPVDAQDRVLPWSGIQGQPYPFRDPNGIEWLMLAANEGVYALRPYNIPLPVPLPEGVKIQTEVSFVQAFNLLFMLRGEKLAPLVMDKVDEGFKDLIERWDPASEYPEGTIVADGPWLSGAVTLDGSRLRVETSDPHGLLTGSDVEIRGTAGGAQDGRYTVVVVDEYNFTFQPSNLSAVGLSLEWSVNRDYWLTQPAVPLEFETDDIVNLPSLAAKLKTPLRPVDEWLAGVLPADTQAALAGYNP